MGGYNAVLPDRAGFLSARSPARIYPTRQLSTSGSLDMKPNRNWFFLSLVVIAGLASTSAVRTAAAEGEAKRIVFIAGAPSHGYGSHEHYAGSKLLAETIAKAGLGIETEVHRGWPDDPGVLESADSIVIYCDGGGGHVAIPHREQMQQLMDAGKGLVCLHYAVEVPKGQPGNDFLNWLGGYFETDWSVNPHWEANFATLPDSLVTRGVQPFKANDEWYFHMRFRPEMEGVQSVLQAVAPEETMRRPDGPHSGNPAVRKEVAEGIPQITAWTFDRPDGGKSFGFTGGHFHWNWGRPEILRLVCNAIVWTADADVPAKGVSLEPVPFKKLESDQDYERPKNFNAAETAEAFKLSSLPMRRPTSQADPEKAESDKSSKQLFASKVITSSTAEHQVAISADITGVEDLFLVVTDGGDGFSCDWADWIAPTLVGPEGEVSLVDLPWKSADSDWGQVLKNKNAVGGPLSVMGSPKATGIGTHANSVIHFRVPAGYQQFRATGALDTGGTSQGNGGSTSVQFLVYAGAVPANVGPSDGSDNPARAAENALAGLELPDDLQATLVASEPNISSLTNLDIDDRGRIWVIDVVNYRGNNGKRPEGDRILILEDLDHDGVADEMKVFYQGRDIDSAMGLCVLGNEVIVSAAPYIWKFIDEDGDDRPDQKIAMFTETGQPQHDHSNHSFLFGPDGKLYWNVGNTGQVVKDASGEIVVDIHGRPIIDNGDPFFGGMPFRCDLDGSNMEVLAHNFRNNWETTVDSFGTIWQSDNDDDGNRGVRINFVMEHGNYGYRDQITGGSWRDSRIGMETEIPLQHWHLNDPGVVPNLLQTGAGSPTGICVYEGRLLPERFWDQIIHCDAGPNVVRAYPVQKSGAGYTAEILPVMTGNRDKWFRPADVCVAPDGSLFVTDWYDPGVGGHRQEDTERGRLFRIAPPGVGYETPKFDYSTPEGAAEALQNPNLAVRFKAWMALSQFGQQAEPTLLSLWNHDNPRVRARALWLLGKLEGRGEHYVGMALRDADEDLRATAIRLARQIDLFLPDVVGQVVDDSSPIVLREAAIALRFCDDPVMPALWAELAKRYQGHDRWYLEALGIGSDGRPAECFDAWMAAVDGDWNTPAGRDLVWRLRAPQAAEKIVAILKDSSLSDKQIEHYFRSIDFHPPEVRSRALQGLLDL
jgi:putative membrane-bound dehydrogenase-like protein